MARMRLLDLVRPFSLALPEVELPYHKVDQTEKLVYTVCAAILFVILAEVPVFGFSESADPISWLRGGLAMSHGTLAEFGVLPIILSGVSIQVLAGLRKITVSLDVRSERVLFQSLQKLVSLGIAAFLSIAVAFSLKASSKTTLFVAAQLFLGSTVTVYIDEVLSKGYGIVTGTVLFTIVRAAQDFSWAALSIESVHVPGRDSYVTYGALPSLFFNLRSRSLKYALTNFVFRSEAPNLIDLLLGVSVFFATLYVSMVRLNLQVRSTRMRAQASTFPVRLVYAGAQPIFFALATVASFLIVSYSLSSILGPNNIVTRVLGVWDASAVPVSGLALYLVPKSNAGIPVFVIGIVIYTLIFAAIGAYIGNTWTQSSGFAPQDIAKQFKESSIVLVGKRDISVVKELRRIIPLAATLGGMFTAVLVAVADFVAPNSLCSTMGIAALGVFNIFEQLASEGMAGPDAMQNFM